MWLQIEPVVGAVTDEKNVLRNPALDTDQGQWNNEACRDHFEHFGYSEPEVMMEERVAKFAATLASETGPFSCYKSLLVVGHCDTFHAVLKHFRIPDKWLQNAELLTVDAADFNPSY